MELSLEIPSMKAIATLASERVRFEDRAATLASHWPVGIRIEAVETFRRNWTCSEVIVTCKRIQRFGTILAHLARPSSFGFAKLGTRRAVARTRSWEAFSYPRISRKPSDNAPVRSGQKGSFMFRSIRIQALVWLFATIALGVPMQINHQGVVTVSGVRFNGNGDFRFALVDPDVGSNGANVWTNDGSNPGTDAMPTAAVNLPVVGGIYNVRLGDTQLTNMTAISASVFSDDNIVLRIWFDDTQGGGVLQLAPDQVLTSAPYAMHAETATNADTVDGLDASQLQSTQPPIGAIVAWHKNLTGVPALPAEWLECNGQTVSDAGSPLNGQVIPDLNGTPANLPAEGVSGSYSGGGRFLRGSMMSGTLQDATIVNNNFANSSVHGFPNYVRSSPDEGVFGVDISDEPRSGQALAGGVGSPWTFKATRPVNMAVVWIIRIK